LFDDETVPASNWAGETSDTCAGLEIALEIPSITVTCTAVVEGVADAVYRPDELIVPRAGDPPVSPFTSHVGFTRLRLPSVAENCTLWPDNRIAVAGVIAMVGADNASE